MVEDMKDFHLISVPKHLSLGFVIMNYYNVLSVPSASSKVFHIRLTFSKVKVFSLPLFFH